MQIAQVVASRATCDRKHVGALLVRDRIILSTGYNGSIRGMPHCDEVGHMMENGHCVATIHAEANAVLQAARNEDLAEEDGVGQAVGKRGGDPGIALPTGRHQARSGAGSAEHLHVGRIAAHRSAIDLRRLIDRRGILLVDLSPLPADAKHTA